MRKLKSAFAILLTVALLLGLCACQPKVISPGNDGTPNGNTASNSNIQIDYEADGEQPMSDKRATEEVLVNTYHTWYKGLDSEVKNALTYEDLAKQIGVEASVFQRSGSYRMYIWTADGDNSKKLHATLQEDDGKWLCVSLNANNLGATQ